MGRGGGLDPRSNSLRAGAWALLFDINGQLISVDSFSGGVSLKRHWSSKSAFRLGVGFSVNSSSSERDEPQRDADQDNYDVSLELLYQRYVNPGAAVNLYWGVGPIAGYLDQSFDSQQDSILTTIDRTESSIGARAMLGVEWFATRDFSLHAEYGASAGYFSTESTNIVERVGGPTVKGSSSTDGWSVGTSSYVRSGLSVYF